MLGSVEGGRRSELRVDARADGLSVVVTCVGELDLDTAPVLRTALLEAVAGGRARVTVELAELAYCDSTGVHVFVEGHETAVAHGGWLRLRNPRPAVRRLLALVGIANVVPVEPPT